MAGHDDGSVNAKQARMTRHALRVISCRYSNHTALFFVVAEKGEFVGCASLLEGRDGLKIFQLQPDIRARHFRECRASNAWRTNNMGCYARMSSKNIGESEKGDFSHVLLFVLPGLIGPPGYGCGLFVGDGQDLIASVTAWCGDTDAITN